MAGKKGTENMNKLEIRALKADEIEVRVAQVGNSNGRGWASLLLYKNARVDQNILDETVGQFNWERDHFECKGNLFCRVSINQNYKDDTLPPVWISKSDCGAESYTEKEKGEASDSFKRACVNWNIGRELYSAPQIFVNVDTEYDERKGSYKIKGKLDFYVKDIYIHKQSNKIMQLTIASKSRGVVYEWDTGMVVESRPAPSQKQAPETAINRPVTSENKTVDETQRETQTSPETASNKALNGKTRVKRT